MNRWFGASEELRHGHGGNELGFDLYAALRRDRGNVALSPLSIASALTMTWLGARGETAEQMGRVLHAGESAVNSAGAIRKLLAELLQPNAEVVVHIVNRLFGERTYSFEPPYLDLVKATFGAPLEPLDFRSSFASARARINDWVAGESEERIKNLIPPTGIDADTRLVLANAIYFLADWAAPFSKEATRPAPFHASATATETVPTMRANGHFAFAALDGVKLLALPYKGGRWTMMLVLPDPMDGLDAVETRLTRAAMDEWSRALDAAPPTLVAVALPKFEINPPEPLALKPLLVALGMPLAFDREGADFTAIADPSSPADRLCVTEVFHKVFVKVDEKGTEAAAATAVVMTRAGGAPRAPQHEFRADHPFLFFVRDLRTKAILFLGRVSNPA